MDITITLRDEFVAEALQAATRINQRLPEQQRQPEPITFTEKDARAIVINWLTNAILQDMAQAAQRNAEQAAADKQRDLQAMVGPSGLDQANP